MKRDKLFYDKAARAIRNGVYPLLALQGAGAPTFNTNEDLVDLCLDLEKNLKAEPFAIFKGIFNQDSWLAILQDARKRGVELQSDYAALEWAAEWNQDTLAGKTSPIERRIEVKMLAGQRQVEVWVINRDQEKPARLQAIRIYRIKDGKEADIGLDGSAVMEALSKPCVLSPEERRVFTTRLVVASLAVYGASGYFAEVELEVGTKLRSNVYKIEKSVE